MIDQCSRGLSELVTIFSSPNMSTVLLKRVTGESGRPIRSKLLSQQSATKMNLFQASVLNFSSEILHTTKRKVLEFITLRGRSP